MLPFVKQYYQALSKLKNILMWKWHLIQNYIAKKKHQNICRSELIYEDKSLKSLVDGKSVEQARQYFNF